MKYSFGQPETGPKAEVGNQPPNLPICPQCGTINIKLQPTCSMCGHALDAAHAPDAGAASAPAPGMTPPNRRYSASKAEKWQRWAWGLVLLMFLLASAGLLIFSLLPPPAPSSDAAKDSGKKGPVYSLPVPGAAVPPDAQQKAQTSAPAQPGAAARTDANANRLAPADARCSDARQALALCSTN